MQASLCACAVPALLATARRTELLERARGYTPRLSYVADTPPGVPSLLHLGGDRRTPVGSEVYAGTKGALSDTISTNYLPDTNLKGVRAGEPAP